MAWTTDDLIADFNRRGQFPDANGSLSSADILAIATEAQRVHIGPVLCVKGSEYYVRDADVAISTSATYRMPARSVVGKLRDLLIVDANGTERSVDYCNPEDAWRYGSLVGTPIAHTIRGELVVLLPTPSGAGETLRMRYYLRRPRFVTVAAAPRITAIDAGLKKVTVAAVPAGWSTSAPVDLIRANGLCEQLGIDLAVSGVSATEVTLSGALPSELALGDYISLAGESSLVCMPEEIYPAFISIVVARAHEAMSNPIWKDALAAGLDELGSAAKLLYPRNEGAIPRAINWNSPLRQGATFRGWR